jgi:hypothetical protein
MSAEEFVHRKNIERYRQMLRSNSLAAEERQKIIVLLTEEEGRESKVRAQADSSARAPNHHSWKS